MDLEGFVRRRIIKGINHAEILSELDEAVKEFKDWSDRKRLEFSQAVIDEVKITEQHLDDPFLKVLLDYPRTGVSMGEFGVGSRGEGDFFVHRNLAEIIKTNAVVDSTQQDDAGVVRGEGKYVTVSIDGMHSRLSDFPYLAGFHVARAALRDVYAMGSKPVALISDLHLADDGDVGKLFDFTAGVGTVSELTDVPTVAGSTLRIGGDMVFGERLVAAVGSVGISSERPTARKNAEVNDVILMTEGSGGGTITTIALYNGYFDVIKETLNVDFMQDCKQIQKGLLPKIHAMTDVTNGGLRGDAAEISKTSGNKLLFYEEMLDKPVNRRVLEMLKELKIDHLGISTDSLMLILPEEYVADVKKTLNNVYEVGCVEKGAGAKILGEKERDFKPLFRESAYTKIKKVVGERSPEHLESIKENIIKAKELSINKKEQVKTGVYNHEKRHG
ncbi:MAG: AIR synthase related protein [Candidatus Hydrothermarchaeaceae archaeon]